MISHRNPISQQQKHNLISPHLFAKQQWDSSYPRSFLLLLIFLSMLVVSSSRSMPSSSSSSSSSVPLLHFRFRFHCHQDRYPLHFHQHSSLHLHLYYSRHLPYFYFLKYHMTHINIFLHSIDFHSLTFHSIHSFLRLLHLLLVLTLLQKERQHSCQNPHTIQSLIKINRIGRFENLTQLSRGVACVNKVARLSNRSSLRNRAAKGLINSNTSSAEDGIFHNSSHTQNSASSGDISESINSSNDSRNFSRDADAPIV